MLRLKKYNSILSIGFVFCSLFSSAQSGIMKSVPNKIDSLTRILEKKPALDSNKVDLQNQLGFEYWIIDPNQSERYGLQSIELSRILPYKKGEAMANRVVGVSHWVRGSYKLAFRYLFIANSLYNELDDSLGIANTLLNLGMVYQDQTDFKKAEEHYKKAISIFSNLNLPDRVATTQTKWGSMLVMMNKNDEAYDKLIAALKIHEANNFLYGIAEVNNKLGELFIQKKEYNAALSYLLQSVEAGAKRMDHVGTADNFQRIGEIYIEKGDNDQAESYLERGKQMAETFNLKSIQKRIYFSLKLLYQKKGNLKQSMQYFDQYAAVSDSLFNEEKANQIASMQIQHEFSQKEKELELAKQDLDLMVEKNKANNLLKIIFILLGLLIGSLVWGLLRRKNAAISKGEQALELAKTETKELKDEIQAKQSELTSYTLNFVQKNELLQEVKTSLDDLRKGADATQKKKLNSLDRLINSAVRIDEDWEDFKKYFDATHQGLIPAIKTKYPKLTQNDLRLLALIRINLSSKEIGSMLGIAPDSVKTARYRLRKKMELESSDNLFEVLLSMGPKNRTNA